MSLTSRFRPVLSRRAPALVFAAAVLWLPACSSDNGGGDATPVGITTVLELLVSSGSDIRGVEADLSFDPLMSLSSVQAVGQFAGQTCEANTGTNFGRLLCARDDSSTFDAPQTLWRLSFAHSSTFRAEDLVLSLTCLGSDAFGNTFPVACELQ